MVSEDEDEDERYGRLHLAYDNVVRRSKQRRKKCIAMEVLKKGVFRRLSISPFHQTQSAESRELIEARLCALLPQILDHTPNHPPYAEMIQRAIERLKQEGGSSELSISTYISSTYADLPWAHSHLLPHHLRKLTEAGEIIATPNSCYSLSSSNPSHSPEQQQQQQPDDDDNDDDDDFPETIIRTRPPGKPRKELSQRSQPPKKGRGKRTKKSRSEQEETTPQELIVETERKQPSLLLLPQPKRESRRMLGQGRR
ncbi:HMG-Y-related protein A [Telopea speciosissima]|uniref:HMG-Y-related protein A n=1 Tax=Telopea speciosissima TaxID=54955 RepID=UPI001CC77369|nr:HMG-Y-related protein A [Telopea speciosissima]